MPRVLNVKMSEKDKFELQRAFTSKAKTYKSMPKIQQLSDGEYALVEDSSGNYLVARQGRKLIKYKGEVI